MAAFQSEKIESSDSLIELDVFFEVLFSVSMVIEFLTDY
jgi:hypothetical protein